MNCDGGMLVSFKFEDMQKMGLTDRIDNRLNQASNRIIKTYIIFYCLNPSKIEKFLFAQASLPLQTSFDIPIILQMYLYAAFAAITLRLPCYL